MGIDNPLGSCMCKFRAESQDHNVILVFKSNRRRPSDNQIPSASSLEEIDPDCLIR